MTKITPGRLALAFAVGSSVYFWYQFRALQAVEAQVGTSLDQVGLGALLAPSTDVQSMQRQAPMLALVAAAVTVAVA